MIDKQEPNIKRRKSEMIKNMKIRKSLVMGYGITIIVSVIIIIAALILMTVQKRQ